jgi:hypothetical protein
MQGNEFDQVEQRVKRYWYDDGISEMAGGLMFVLLGLYFWGQGMLAEGSLAQILLESGLIIVLLVGAFASRWLVNTLKERLTYPRTGYVAYRKKTEQIKRTRIVVGIVAALVASFSVVLANIVGSFAWMPALSGLLVGAILAFLRARGTGINRFYMLAALSVGLGLVLSLSGLPDGFSLGLFYGLMGVCFILSGALTLRSYLQENPLPQEMQDE